MSEPKPITRTVPAHQAQSKIREVASRRTFSPTVTESGELKAGGCTLGTVEAGPNGEPLLIVPDLYWPRRRARGTSDVPVNLEQAAEEARRYIATTERCTQTNT